MGPEGVNHRDLPFLDEGFHAEIFSHSRDQKLSCFCFPLPILESHTWKIPVLQEGVVASHTPSLTCGWKEEGGQWRRCWKQARSSGNTVGRPLWEADFRSSPEVPKRQPASQTASSLRTHLPDLLPHLSTLAWLPSLCPVLALPTCLLTQTLSSACPRLHCSHTRLVGWSLCVHGLWRMPVWALGAAGSLWAWAPPTFRQEGAASLGLAGGSDSHHLGLKFISNSLSF